MREKVIQSGKEMRFRNASGGRMNHYGSRAVTFRTDGGEGRMMGLDFQVSDVRKPLAAVWRIAQSGNIVQFGPSDEECFIMNKGTGEKVGLRRKGGSYVMGVEYMKKVNEEVVFPGRV